jgi:hypothetical protein
MSHSAIKSVNCTTDAANNNKDDVDGGSDGVNDSYTKLSKMNLKVKFDGVGGGGGILKKPLWAQQLWGGGSGQQQQPQQLQQLPISEPNGGNGWQEKATLSSLAGKKRACILGSRVTGPGGDDLTIVLISFAANHWFVPAIALAYAAPVIKDHRPTFCMRSNANNYSDGVQKQWHGRLPLKVPHDMRGQSTTPSMQQQLPLNFSMASSTLGLMRRMVAGGMKSLATDDSPGTGWGGEFLGQHCQGTKCCHCCHRWLFHHVVSKWGGQGKKADPP